MAFSNIASQFVAYLFILLAVSFAEWKILILMMSNLSVSVMDHASGVVSLKSHHQGHLDLLLCYLL